MRRWRGLLGGALAGAVCGWAIYHFYGCRHGCPLSGSVGTSMLVFAYIGLRLTQIVRFRRPAPAPATQPAGTEDAAS